MGKKKTVPSLEEQMAFNLNLTYPLVRDIFSKYSNLKGMSKDNLAEMVLQEFFKAHKLNMEHNKGLFQVLYALLCVDRLQPEDIVIMVTKDSLGNDVAGDYTMPDWVSDKYAGTSMIEAMLKQVKE